MEDNKKIECDRNPSTVECVHCHYDTHFDDDRCENCGYAIYCRACVELVTLKNYNSDEASLGFNGSRVYCKYHYD